MTSPDSSASSGPLDPGFAALGLGAGLVAAVTALGYEEPTDIQREAIPPLLDGRDLLGQAATGTGKTAAFALPLLQRIGSADGAPAVRALILVPTRELAMQVAAAVHRYGKSNDVSVLPIYGGQDIRQQLRALRRGVDVVVATPGRALDHIRRDTLTLDGVRVVILDEADEMLDMGFADDLEAILDATPEARQTALFSATLPARIMAIANRHLRDPVRITIARETVTPGEAPRVREVAYIVQRRQKLQALGRILDLESPTSAIVFCRTRTEVDELTESLTGRGYSAQALHGGLSQDQRDRVMRRFRDGAVELLVATDVAARGLDVEHVSHVVNYDVPPSGEAYVHRIGRTGRAGREGVAITLAEPREHRLLRNIEHMTKRRISVETIPTIHDLRARRLELTRAKLEEALRAGELDGFRGVVESLAEEFDALDVAAAAVKLMREAEGVMEEDEIEIVAAPRQAGRPRRGRDGESRFAFGPERGDRGARRDGPPGIGRDDERPTDDTERLPGRRPRARPARGGPGISRIYVGLGRARGLRPADLVGAIANEAGIDSRDIGAIDIADRFSLVEVPDDAADEIIRALRGTTIRGQRVTVRREGTR
jgi:ATP-dependent RNA helicase DeaD